MSLFSEQRLKMVERYKQLNYIRSDGVADSILKVPRELFMDPKYEKYAYSDQPYPIPGDGMQTISAPYMYPIVYEAIKLKKGDKFLEIGAGSGYGAALAYELVSPTGKVVTIEINPRTFDFARKNLINAKYGEVIVLKRDGSLGYPEEAPYDAISITAPCSKIPEPLVEQLNAPGKLIAPVGNSNFYGQDLVLLEKTENGEIKKRMLMKVAYVPLTGEYGRR